MTGQPLLEPQQERLLVTLADAWAVERREFHVMHGYGEWKMYHPGLHPANTADEGTPLMWPDIEEFAAASLARITSPGTSFVLTAAGVRYAKQVRQGTDAARAEGVGRVETLTKAAALERLDGLLRQLDGIKSAEPHSNVFQKWQRDVAVAIRHIFGEQSVHVEDFRRISFAPRTPAPTGHDRPTPEGRQREAGFFLRGMESTRAALESMRDEIRDYWTDEPQAVAATPPQGAATMTAPARSRDKVFIIHGHDHQLKQDVEVFLRRIGLDVSILHQLPRGGRTIIEMLEAYSAVDYAVALLTPDDIGATDKAYNDATQRVPLDGPASTLAVELASTIKHRARQNVVLELGLFLGKHGRGSVSAIVAHGVEIPSDYAGVLYIPVAGDGEADWRTLLRRDLDYKGLAYDHTKV